MINEQVVLETTIKSELFHVNQMMMELKQSQHADDEMLSRVKAVQRELKDADAWMTPEMISSYKSTIIHVIRDLVQYIDEINDRLDDDMLSEFADTLDHPIHGMCLNLNQLMTYMEQAKSPAVEQVKDWTVDQYGRPL